MSEVESKGGQIIAKLMKDIDWPCKKLAKR